MQPLQLVKRWTNQTYIHAAEIETSLVEAEYTLAGIFVAVHRFPVTDTQV